MVRIRFSNGFQSEYPAPISVRALLAEVAERYTDDVLGIAVDGKPCDLDAVLDQDCEIQPVTGQTSDGRCGAAAFWLCNHSAAHVFAEALQAVVPGALLVYGPPVDAGFFYDVQLPGHSLSPDDFPKIEAEMRRIVLEDRPFARYELTAEAGLAKLRSERSKFKLDNAERALSQDPAAKISFYVTGERGRNWEDLCRGPHLPSTGRIGAFKLLSVASSYWKGDERLDRLTRVYGVAFPTQHQLDAHLQQLQEAKERDHRVTGRRLQLFLTDDAVGQGLILWPPAGTIVRDQLQIFIQEELSKRGYSMVHTPHIGRLELYRTSGHFPYYRDSQFPPMVDPVILGRFVSEGRTCGELANRLAGDGEPVDGYLLKPMNCPHHIKIFASVPRSYRELPVRLGEFGTVYRWEQSGEIGGLTRVRGFTQDDAHLFCTESQVGDELRGCLDLVRLVFGQLGMNDYRVRVGLRDPNSSKYVGTPDQWAKAERDCREAAAALGVSFSEERGEAAFYGPKIDFVVRDILGREWQLGTVQCDYNLPQRFELTYVGADNQRHAPVMIHRAPFGSLERFVGVLIEHFNGAFPTWLSPEQVRVLTVTDACREYGEVVLRAFQEAGIRATLEASSERLPAKIRAASEMKIPYLLVVGPRDQASGAVSVRVRDLQKDIGQMQLADVVAMIRDEVKGRRLRSFAAGDGN